MKYFNVSMTLEQVKKTYKEWAFKLHSDVNGGDDEAMKDLNVQFEYAYKYAKTHNIVSEEEKKETAESFTRHFYTQNGWQGSRYDSSLSTTDIAKKVREYAKYSYPDFKFSISCKYFSGGSSCTMTLMKSPYELTNEELLDKWCRSHTENYGRTEFYNGENWVHEATEENIRKYKEYVKKSIYENWQFNQYYDFGNDMAERSPIDIRVLSAIKDVMNYLQSYNWSDCDGSVDYFDVNFYYHISIGKYDKPCVVETPKNWKLSDKSKKEVKVA